jgi:cell division protein FtsB
VASVDHIVPEQQGDYDQRERYESLRAKRERMTVTVIVIAAVAVLGALAVSYQGNRELVRETSSAAAEQHADMLAVLAKTDAQIAALKDQSDTLRAQLDEMKTSSALLRSDFAGTMQLDNVRVNNSTGWFITPKWSNTGKTEVLNFKGWNHLQLFPSLEEFKRVDFSKIPRGASSSEPQVVFSGDYVIYANSQVTMMQAWEEIYEKAVVISWGYVEYDDIFGTHHFVQHCESWGFQYEPPAINIGLPQPLSLNCNRRT